MMVFFLAPAPMYASYREVFEAALENHSSEQLLPYKARLNLGFEVPLTISHHDKEYVFRMILLYDHQLFARKQKSLTQRIEQTHAAFKEQAAKLNRYRLKTQESIEKACQSILQKYQTTDFLTYSIIHEPIITYKQAKQGRRANGEHQEKVKIVTDHFRVELVTNQSAIDHALWQCGYYPLITNKSETELSLADAMLAHKDQYKPEHTHRRSKSGYRLEPIYLHIPERIEVFLFLFKLVLQLLVLMERTARKNIERRDKGINNFRPNRKDVRNPTAEYLLKEFQYIVRVSMTLPDNRQHIVVSDLTEVQKDILSLLEVPLDCFTARYLFHSG